VRAMRDGRVSDLHVTRISKCDKPMNVESVVPFLQDGDPYIRLCAARVVAAKGDMEGLMNMAMIEENRNTLLEVLKLITNSDDAVTHLVKFLKSEDTHLREGAISMYRRIGREDMLLALVFSHDEELANRIKSYINERD